VPRLLPSILLCYNLTENFTVNVGLEKFNYDDAFKSSYAIAPVEERASIELQYEKDNLKVFWSTVWFGEKNLSDYGYEGYNKLNDASTVKTLVGKSFSMSDIKVQYQLTAHTKVYAGVSNVFEQTQIDDGDTPLFYDAEGSYDVAYIYGALHGREMYAGVEIKL